MRTSWQKPANRGLLFNCVGGRLLEPILTQTAHFLVPLQRLKSLNHHPQWRVGNFGENYHAETIHYTRCGQKPCALTTRRSRSVRSRRLVAGRCNEQLGKKRAAHRIRVGGHSARCNLGLLRNALAGWSALIRSASRLSLTEPDCTRGALITALSKTGRILLLLLAPFGHFCWPLFPLNLAARRDRRRCDQPDLGCTGRGGRGRWPPTPGRCANSPPEAIRRLVELGLKAKKS